MVFSVALSLSLSRSLSLPLSRSGSLSRPPPAVSMCIVVAQDLLQLCCARLKKNLCGPLGPWAAASDSGHWDLGSQVVSGLLSLSCGPSVKVLAFSVLGHYSFKVQARTSVFLEIAL